jgi:hypothetical protein
MLAQQVALAEAGTKRQLIYLGKFWRTALSRRMSLA